MNNKYWSMPDPLPQGFERVPKGKVDEDLLYHPSSGYYITLRCSPFNHPDAWGVGTMGKDLKILSSLHASSFFTFIYGPYPSFEIDTEGYESSESIPILVALLSLLGLEQEGEYCSAHEVALALSIF